MNEEEILNKIDAWHDGEGLNQTLEQYLGWTKEQYELWFYIGVLMPPGIARRLVLLFSPDDLRFIKKILKQESMESK